MHRIRLIKEYCPYSYVRMNSNGDYLTKDFLEELNAVGLDEILVTRHMDGDGVYTDESAKEKIESFFSNLSIEGTITKMENMHNISCDLFYKGIRFLVVTNNWRKDGTDRGGIVKSLSIDGREQPCCTPFREMFIDVNGAIRFCFNIFVNDQSLANIADSSLVDIYFSDEMVDIRREHLIWGRKGWPCETCNTPDNASLETSDRRNFLLKDAVINEMK